MATFVGLDIGTRTVAVAVVTGTVKKLHLQDFFVEEIPEMVASSDGPPTAETVDLEEGLPPSLGEFIKKLLADRKLEGADVVASLDAKDCIVRDRIKVPFTREDQIEKTIAFEAENHLITFDLEEMVLEYHKVGESGGESVLFLMAFPDEVVQQRLDVLKEAGVDPVALDLDAAALFNAYALTPTYASDPGRTTLLVDVGATTSTVALVEEGRLKMVRSLRLGAYLGAFNPRQIAAPVGAAVGAGVAEGGPASSLDFELPDASSIEARFDEIESALRRIEPLGDDVAAGLFGSDEDEPIAILTDDEYARITNGSDAEAGEEAPLDAAGEDADAGGRTEGGAEAPAGGGTAAADSAAGGGRDGGRDGGQDYERFLDRLGLEIQRTFATATAAPIDLVCLTGGMSHREETCRYFARNFDVETIALDFGESGESFTTDLDSERLDEVNRLGAVAVGLAVKEAGGDRVGLDFRKKQFRYERRFERLKFPLLCLAVMTCALFLWTAYDQFSKFNSRRAERERLFNRGRQYYTAFFGSSYPGNVPLSRAIKSMEDKYRGFLGKGSQIPQFLPEIEAIREVADVLRKAKKTLSFEITSMNMSFQIRQPRGASRKNAPRQPRALEQDWRIELVADDTIGEDLRRLFRNSARKLWECEPSERQRGGRIIVTLTLKPNQSYLANLQR